MRVSGYLRNLKLIRTTIRHRLLPAPVKSDNSSSTTFPIRRLRAISSSIEFSSRFYGTAAQEIEDERPASCRRPRLRPYQEECVQSVLRYLEQGHKRLGISLATGGGKTVIFTRLIDRIPPLNALATQTLILVHRRELAEQAAQHCASAYPEKSIEIEMGNSKASGHADITIASIQSLISGTRMQKFVRERFKLILVDEAHHIVATSYLQALGHFGLVPLASQSPALVGVSATFSRFDGLKLGTAIDHIVYHKDYVEMIEQNWLSGVKFTTVQSKADLSKVSKTTSGDYTSSALSNAVNTPMTNEITVRAWLDRARGRSSTLVFCADIDHIIGLADTFRKHGVDARFVTGDTPPTSRAAILDGFKNFEFQVLLNCGVFTEGTDIPNIDCVLLARPTRSRNLLIQMIGRGMRKHERKFQGNCLVIDMVASLDTGIVTTPSLFGLDPLEIVAEASVEDLKKRSQLAEETMEQSTTLASTAHEIDPNASVTFTDYNSIHDLIDDTSGDKHIRTLSQLAWINVGADRYILNGAGGDYLSIEKKDGAQLYSVLLHSRLPPSRTPSPSRGYKRNRCLAEADGIEAAVHSADRYATEHFPYTLLYGWAEWRNAPATDGQLMFLNKLRNEDDKLTAQSLTKGKAAEMITRIKHGARGRMSSILAGRRRQQKEEEEKSRLVEMRRREIVRVGPVAK